MQPNDNWDALMQLHSQQLWPVGFVVYSVATEGWHIVVGSGSDSYYGLGVSCTSPTNTSNASSINVTGRGYHKSRLMPIR